MKKALLILFTTLCFSQNTIDKKKALKIHNDARKEVGTSPLLWSEKLEKQAHFYAKILARKDQKKRMQHSQTNDGENLTYSYGYEKLKGKITPIYSKTPLSDASAGWYEEKKDYKYSKIKRIRVGPPIGHYTQMVWKDTKEVGISYAISKSGSVYVVARYYPPGNYSGEYPY